MKCNKIQKKISRQLDDELDPQLEIFIREHLKSCPSCSAVSRKFKRVDELLQDDFRLSAEPYLLTRIKAKVSKASHLPSQVWVFSQRVLAPATIFAGLLLGILIGIKLHGFVGQQPITEQQTRYSIIDSNMFEPLPTGSITATYASMNGPTQ